MGLQNDDKLNSLQKRLPEGVVASSAWLVAQGYSRQLVRKYVQGHWLTPLGRGVYARPTATVNWEGVVLGMQQLEKLPFHVGGISALNRQGYAHYLPLKGETQIHLWGRGKVPAWIKAVTLPEQLNFHTGRLFNDKTERLGLVESSTRLRDWTLQTSGPERAIFEVLNSVDSGASSFAHAAQLFEGLTVLRPGLLNELLMGCVSIKTKRLFLFLATYFDYPWLKKLDIKRVALGSGKRSVVKGGRLDKQFLITVPEKFGAERG